MSNASSNEEIPGPGAARFAGAGAVADSAEASPDAPSTPLPAAHPTPGHRTLSEESKARRTPPKNRSASEIGGRGAGACLIGLGCEREEPRRDGTAAGVAHLHHSPRMRGNSSRAPEVLRPREACPAPRRPRARRPRIQREDYSLPSPLWSRVSATAPVPVGTSASAAGAPAPVLNSSIAAGRAPAETDHEIVWPP